MGFLWEWYGNSMGPAYHKGVPLLGVPGITLDYPILQMFFQSRMIFMKVGPSRIFKGFRSSFRRKKAGLDFRPGRNNG